MALEAMLWATMPGREVCGPSLTEMHDVHLHTDTSFQLCTQRSIQDMNMRSLESQLRVCYLADFFTSGLNLRLPVAICGMIAIYILSYFFWGFIWLLVYW